MLKIVFINLLTMMSLLFLLLISPPLIYNLYQYVKENSDRSLQLSDLDIYKNYDWSYRYYEERKKLKSKYKDFVVHRSHDLAGDTINITNGIRRTVLSKNIVNDTKFFFFGGSTTWGAGVNDTNTYPSLFSQLYNVETYNFGESEWIARQSLAMLNNIIISKTYNLINDEIIFYDGVNDVSNYCRSGVDGLSTARENQIKKIIEDNSPQDKWSYTRLFSQVLDLFNIIKIKINPKIDEQNNFKFNCHISFSNASKAAKKIVSVWEQAQKISQINNLNFTAILQPVAYLSDINLEKLNLLNSSHLLIAKQYEAVYPLIITYAKERNINLIDLTKLYDKCENCYIDYCHVGPKAHEKLIRAIGKNLF